MIFWAKMVYVLSSTKTVRFPRLSVQWMKLTCVTGWPSMGLRFSPEVNASYYLNVLLDAAKAYPDQFDVYTHETMPKRYHFANNARIAPIYVVPKIGYALTTREEGDVGMSKGVSTIFFSNPSQERTNEI